MKKNLQLINAIMLSAEANSTPGDNFVPEIDGFDSDTIFYHIQMAGEDGLLNVTDESSKDGPCFEITGITRAGYNYLESIR